MGSCFCVWVLDIFRLKNGMEWPCPMNSQVFALHIAAEQEQKRSCVMCLIRWENARQIVNHKQYVFFRFAYTVCAQCSLMMRREQNELVFSIWKKVFSRVNGSEMSIFIKCIPQANTWYHEYFTTNYWYKAPVSVDYKGFFPSHFFYLSSSTDTSTAYCIFQDLMERKKRMEHKEWMCSFSLTLVAPQNYLKNEFYSDGLTGVCITNTPKKRHDYFWSCLLTTENHMGNKRNMKNALKNNKCAYVVNGWHLNTFTQSKAYHKWSET